MDDCIRTGVSSAEEKLPGRLGLRRRAPLLYRRLMRGCSVPVYNCHRGHVRLTLAISPFLRSHSFYPGLSAPTLPAIGAGALPVGHIGAPDGFAPDGNSVPGADAGPGFGGNATRGHLRSTGTRIAASRPTRVVGVLDHPVTPMPPVSGAALGLQGR